MKSSVLTGPVLSDPHGWLHAQAEQSEPVVWAVLVACSQVMLPYWEAHFNRDEGMACLVGAMLDWSRSRSNSDPQSVVTALHAVAQPLQGWLSYPGDPRPIGNTCPADFAGDSIVSAANAIMEHGEEGFRRFVHKALRDAVETIARVMGERQPEDETTDFWSLAVRHLQEEIQKRLIENGCPGS